MECKKCKKDLPAGALFCPWCGKQQAHSSRRGRRGNGQGTVYQLANGTWRAEINVYSCGQRFRRTKEGFKAKKDALACLPALRASLALSARGDITIMELYAEWSAQHFKTLSASKQQQYQIAYAHMQKLHPCKLSQIRYADLQQVVDERDGGYYPKRDIKQVLSLMYKYALQNDYCTKNYAQFIKLPHQEPSKKDAFTQEELAAMWQDYQAGHSFTRYPLIMCYTGLRYGELALLEKTAVDLEHQCALGGIKTDAGKNREILFCDKVMPLVREAWAACDTRLMELSEGQFYKEYWAMIGRIGARQLSPHCCRHTTATLLAEEDVQPAIIKEIMGHSNYAMTTGYTHISRTEKLKALNRVAANPHHQGGQ